MKKIILIGIILLSFTSLLNAQWIRIYGTIGDDRAHLVLETNDGGCIVAGTSRPINTSLYNLLVLKLDSNGAIEWQKAYGTESYIHLYFLIQTNDGGYLAAGTESSYSSVHFWVLKLDQWGDIDSEGSFGRYIGFIVQSAKQTNDGGYLLAGYDWEYDEEWRQVGKIPVIKITLSGEIEWQIVYKISTAKEINSIQQTADGGFILSGNVLRTGYGEDIIVLKLFPGGNMEWQATYGSGTYNDDTSCSIQQTSDGGYILIGHTRYKYTVDEYGDKDALVLKLSSTGNLEWSHVFGGNGDDYASSIQQTSDGGYIVAGTTFSFGSGEMDIWISKLSSSGEIDWQRTYGAHSAEMAHSIQQTSDDGYLAAGSIQSFGAGSFDYLIMKLLPDGQISLPCRFINEPTSAPPALSFWHDQMGALAPEEENVIYGFSVCLDPRISDLTEYELCSQQPLLAIISSDGGTTTPAPGTYINDPGVEVEIRAIPESGYRFGEWNGDATGIENPLTVIMDSDKSVMASFIGQFSLTILAGEGGTTDPEPGTYIEDSGTEVSIKALPETGYQFSEWSGVVERTSNPITITMNLDISVTANFVPVEKDDKNVLDKIFRIATCAIATAAYDSPSHPYVKILREFRDKYLMRTNPGRSLVKIYYKYSPLAARCIAKHKLLKIIIRFYLLPVVAFSYSMVRFGPLLTAIISLLILAIPIFFVSITQKRNKRAEARR
jgi:hypothetical protein